jgi:hypothetical protein
VKSASVALDLKVSPSSFVVILALFGLLSSSSAQTARTMSPAVIVNFDPQSPLQGTAALLSDEPVGVLLESGVSGLEVAPEVIRQLMKTGDAVIAKDGRMLLSAHAVNTLQGAVIHASGPEKANELVKRNGQIFLDASPER